MALASVHEVLKDAQMFHSAYQMEHFIIGKVGATPYAQYRQCVRELLTRFRGIRSIFYRQRNFQMKLQEAEQWLTTNRHDGIQDDKIDATDSTDVVNKRHKKYWAYHRKELAVEQLHHGIEEVRLNLAESYREFTHFYRMAAALKEVVGELTETRRNKLDAEMWSARAKMSAAMDLTGKGSLGPGTLDLVMSLAPKDRWPLMDELKDRAKVIDWLRSAKAESPQLADVLIPTVYELKELACNGCHSLPIN